MRFIFTLCVGSFLFIATQTTAQKSTSCCQMSSVQEFAALASDITFVISHEEPIPFTLENQSGKMVTFPVKGDEAAQGYYIEGSNNQWIFVIQEWWGLNDYIKQEAEKLHESFPTAHILALDMYDGKVATTREDAGAFMQGAKPERLEAIIEAASAFSGENAKISTIGWCFGGAWSNKASILLGKKVVACIMYYGMPVLDESQLEKISAPVLGIFADQDGWITPKVVGEFKEKMTSLGKEIDVYSYDAVHAFANPSNPNYNKEYSADAWSKVIDFLNKHI